MVAKVDVSGYGNAITVRDSETQEVLDVTSLSLYLTPGGVCYASLFIRVGRLDVRGLELPSIGVNGG